MSRVVEQVIESLDGADSHVGRELFNRLVAQINSQVGKPTDTQKVDELFSKTQDAGLVDIPTFLRQESTRQYFIHDGS